VFVAPFLFDELETSVFERHAPRPLNALRGVSTAPWDEDVCAASSLAAASGVSSLLPIMSDICGSITATILLLVLPVVLKS